MSADGEVYRTLLSCGIRGTAAPGYPVGKAPPLPWFVYDVQPGRSLFADGRLWYGAEHVTVDLYQRDRDEALEASIGAACDALGNAGARPAHTWLKEESAWVTSFDFDYSPETGAQIRDNDNG